MKLFKKVLAGVAVATALAVPAHAAVMGISDMTVLGLGFTNPAGLTSIVISNESRTGNASATYNGVSVAGAAAGSSGTVNVLPQCVGNCAGAATLYAPTFDNSTTHIGLAPLFNYALGDMVISGAAFGGPIQGLTRANAVAGNPTNTGSANATIFNGGSITGTFTPGTTFTSGIFLTADAFLRTWIGALAAGESATSGAGLGWNLQVLGSDIAPLAFAPGELNQSFFRVIAGDTLFSTNGNGNGTSTYTSASRTFSAGTVYTFAINQSSNAAIADRIAIPEPESLALLGLGLLGLAITRRRKLV